MAEKENLFSNFQGFAIFAVKCSQIGIGFSYLLLDFMMVKHSFFYTLFAILAIFWPNFGRFLFLLFIYFMNITIICIGVSMQCWPAVGHSLAFFTSFRPNGSKFTALGHIPNFALFTFFTLQSFMEGFCSCQFLDI